jgi:hypothetical protein
MKIKRKIEVEIEVDDQWIELLTKYNDIFRTDHCGYWLAGMERNDELGWLAHEQDDDENANIVSRSPEYQDIVDAWLTGRSLPERWFRINKETAIAVWIEGVKEYGIAWYETSDANTYDYLIQKVLLGEHRYA